MYSSMPAAAGGCIDPEGVLTPLEKVAPCRPRTVTTLQSAPMHRGLDRSPPANTLTYWPAMTAMATHGRNGLARTAHSMASATAERAADRPATSGTAPEPAQPQGGDRGACSQLSAVGSRKLASTWSVAEKSTTARTQALLAGWPKRARPGAHPGGQAQACEGKAGGAPEASPRPPVTRRA